MKIHEIFRKFATWVAQATGTAYAFSIALLCIVIWALLGPVYNYSDTWQLVVNTATTIITFLMVFLIQRTQNRDSLALHLKVDELIRAIKQARNELIDVEDLSEEEIDRLKKEFEKKAKRKESEKK